MILKTRMITEYFGLNDVFFADTVLEEPLRDVLITHWDDWLTDAFHAASTIQRSLFEFPYFQLALRMCLLFDQRLQ